MSSSESHRIDWIELLGVFYFDSSNSVTTPDALQT